MNTNNAYLALPNQILCIINYLRGCDLEKLRGQGLNAIQLQKNFVFPNISPLGKSLTPRQVKINKLPNKGGTLEYSVWYIHEIAVGLYAHSGSC